MRITNDFDRAIANRVNQLEGMFEGGDMDMRQVFDRARRLDIDLATMPPFMDNRETWFMAIALREQPPAVSAPIGDGGWHRGDWMQTYTGGRFYPLAPTREDVNPLDIAHALSMLCRYNGHIDRFYSVAEHCVLMSEWIERAGGSHEEALEALLHDASEAYVGDMVRPLKHSGAMDAYKVVEDRVMLAVAERFGLPILHDADAMWHPKSPIVQEADTRILLTERTALMSNYKPSDRWSADGVEALPVAIQAWGPAEAERAYLERLSLLGVEL